MAERGVDDLSLGDGPVAPQQLVLPGRHDAEAAVLVEADRPATHREVLGYIPCYCGCVRDGHRDNFDCYVAEARVDGWVVLDTHGFG